MSIRQGARPRGPRGEQGCSGRGQCDRTPADGYRAGKPTTATKKVTVSGPATDLAQVSKAVAAVDVTGRNSSLADYECRVTLYDQDGAAFTSNYITSQTEKIKVSVPIYRVNNIPLTVTLKDGGSLTQNQVQCVIDPENVEVIASNQAVLSDNQGDQPQGEIDLGSVHTARRSPCPSRISCRAAFRSSAVSQETANVTISVDGVATRKVQVSKFAWNDTAQENTPYTVNILTKSVEMELRGSESQLKKVDVNNLSIGLTYDSVSLGVGRHTVKGVATTVGLPSGVTLVEEDIEVEIEITDAHVSDETITSDKTDSTDDTDSTVATDRAPYKEGRWQPVSDGNRHPSPFDLPEQAAIAEARRLTGLTANDIQAAVCPRQH